MFIIRDRKNRVERAYAALAAVWAFTLALGFREIDLAIYGGDLARATFVGYAALLTLIAVRPSKQLHMIGLPLGLLVTFGRASSYADLIIRFDRADLWASLVARLVLAASLGLFHYLGVLANRGESPVHER